MRRLLAVFAIMTTLAPAVPLSARVQRAFHDEVSGNTAFGLWFTPKGAT